MPGYLKSSQMIYVHELALLWSMLTTITSSLPLYMLCIHLIWTVYKCACVFKYVCVCVSVCMCMCVSVCKWVCVSMYAYECERECVGVCVSVCVICVCIYVCVCVCGVYVWSLYNVRMDIED